MRLLQKPLIKEINDIIHNFICEETNAKIAQNTLSKDIDQGGLKLCHYPTKIRYSKDHLQSTKRNKILSNPKVVPKKWWPTYKRIISQNGLTTIGPLINVNKVLTDDLTNANLLNNIFVSESTLDESEAQLPQTHHTPSTQLIRKS